MYMIKGGLLAMCLYKQRNTGGIILSGNSCGISAQNVSRNGMQDRPSRYSSLRWVGVHSLQLIYALILRI